MKDKPADIPHLPGCYLFKDGQGEVLYVGKAGDLAKRVAQYFHSKRTLRQRILVEKSDSLEFIAVHNEVEALLLENNLIKHHQPRYNINLKDAKSYAYLELTAEPFPRLVVSRITRATAEGERFGPFVSAQERDRIRTVLNRLFRLRTCRKFPKRPCIRHHIGACSAPCIAAVGEAQYQEQIEDARLVLKGEIRQVRERLQTRMAAASAQQRYEEALTIRRRIEALESLRTEQTVDRDRRIDEDAMGYLLHAQRLHVLIFHLSRGRVMASERFSFEGGGEAWEEFLVQYYGSHPCPPELILPEPVEPPLADYLSAVAGRKVRLTIPRRGRKHHILAMIAQNLELAVRHQLKHLQDLQHHLGLAGMPQIIEGFDISHLSGGYTVASMVQFSAGQPNKTGYRRFRIRSQAAGNDLMAMEEVVRRRYSRLLQEGLPQPDLILIDGGPTQLASASQILRELNLTTTLCSLAKREEQVFLPGRKAPLPIPRTAPGLKLLQQVRDEAHRFAHGYNRLLRKKGAFDAV
jgi:excinuclease ABC subunit C